MKRDDIRSSLKEVKRITKSGGHLGIEYPVVYPDSCPYDGTRIAYDNYMLIGKKSCHKLKKELLFMKKS